MHKHLAVPHRLQFETGYCLPACVEMVLAYWGLEAKQKGLARKLKTIPGVGTPGPRVQALASRSLRVTYGEGQLVDLMQAIAADIPPVVLVRTRELPYWFEDTPHAVVITGVENDLFYVNDPAVTSVNVQVTQEDLYLAWDLMANLYVLLQPK